MTDCEMWYPVMHHDIDHEVQVSDHGRWRHRTVKYVSPEGQFNTAYHIDLQRGPWVDGPGPVTLQYQNGNSKFENLKSKVRDVYYAAYWHADRKVDEDALWIALRDAAEIEPGHSFEKLGEDQSNG